MTKSAIFEALTGTGQPGLLGYVTEFNDLNQRLAHQPAWMNALRREGYTRFSEGWFPTTHDEDWRFTNVAPIAQTRFKVAGHVRISPNDLEKFGTSGFACQLTFINGRFAPGLSRIPTLPKGVTVGGLAAQITSHPEAVEKHLGHYLNFYRDAFCALNTAFIDDGAYIHVPRNTVVEHPIYLLYVSAGGANSMDHPRNLIVVEENSQATIVEDYVSLDGSVAFSNAVTELVAAQAAVVSHYMIVRENEQTYNVSTLRIQQERSSNVATHSVLLGGALVRNNVHPVLAGEGGECLINGLFMANGRQHMDNYMLVEHASPHCNSRQFYNGILNGQSHGVFHGRIIVHKDAQKTDAKQTNRNLLLSDDAQIDTKPQLEIYADDVKCTHGATIGQVDENALFYLRSRGLSETSAKHLLLQAFANECMARMSSAAVREHIERLVAQSLPETAKFAGERTVVAERSFEEVG
ncbi:MAG TPA: Fe-S cluster assembly protein SufD [Candidatus Angelobacter sp.]|nr:Fe-S cluster assembly protein SufD [Candidatus Angelobacter sp.]